jgi:diguanylate cyclase (GGDEF)-like protein
MDGEIRKGGGSDIGVTEVVPFRSMLGYSARVALALHLAFAVFFQFVGATGLTYYNVGSVVFYALAPLLLRPHVAVVFALVTLEVVAHAWYAVHVIGWNSGFQYYLFVVAPLAFFNPCWPVIVKGIHLSAVFLAYLAMNYWCADHSPSIVLSVATLRTVNEINVIGSLIFLAFFAHYYSKIAHVAENRLEQMATTDMLTGLHNRRHLVRIAHHELARHRRSGRPVALIMMDIDDFKSVNDEYGHECGDFVLRAAAARLRESMREQDQLARWGGEEFVILLPETDRDGAREVAEKLRAAVAAAPVEFTGRKIDVRLTAGVCLIDPHEAFDSALSRADRAMLEGKHAGKNRVVVAPSSDR